MDCANHLYAMPFQTEPRDAKDPQYQHHEGGGHAGSHCSQEEHDGKCNNAYAQGPQVHIR